MPLQCVTDTILTWKFDAALRDITLVQLSLRYSRKIVFGSAKTNLIIYINTDYQKYGLTSPSSLSSPGGAGRENLRIYNPRLCRTFEQGRSVVILDQQPAKTRSAARQPRCITRDNWSWHLLPSQCSRRKASAHVNELQQFTVLSFQVGYCTCRIWQDIAVTTL